VPHALVTQLRFTRGEFLRGLDGLTPDDAARRFGAINPIAWMVGHLAWHEQILWLERAQGRTVAPAVKECRFGGPPSTPALGDMLAAWRDVTEAAEPYLDALTSEALAGYWEKDGRRHPESIGTSLRRVTYHYWFHLGESQAVRQLLGHRDLPQFVGDINRAPYVPEASRPA
jgi:DinB family protein